MDHAGKELAKLAWEQRSQLNLSAQLSLVSSINAAGCAADSSLSAASALVPVGRLSLQLHSILSSSNHLLTDILLASRQAGSDHW